MRKFYCQIPAKTVICFSSRIASGWSVSSLTNVTLIPANNLECFVPLTNALKKERNERSLRSEFVTSLDRTEKGGWKGVSREDPGVIEIVGLCKLKSLKCYGPPPVLHCTGTQMLHLPILWTGGRSHQTQSSLCAFHYFVLFSQPNESQLWGRREERWVTFVLLGSLYISMLIFRMVWQISKGLMLTDGLS